MPITDPAQDQEFLSAKPEEQHAYLLESDPDYAKASPADQKAYIKHVTGQGVINRNATPTKFEQENARPYMENLGARAPERGMNMEPQEYLGLPSRHVLGAAWEGAKGLVGSGLQGAYDLALGQANPKTGEIEHGIGGLVGMNTQGEIAPLQRAQAIAHKYITGPAGESVSKAEEALKRGDTMEALGHGTAAALPLVGPWAEHLGERAGTGDIGGMAGEIAGTVGAGEILPRIAKNAPAIADKLGRGTPITETGKLQAAREQALTVKKPTMTETEYAQKVSDAMPELQKIAQDNKGQITTPRQATRAINTRISQIEAPVAEHLKTITGPYDTIHPEDYQPTINAAVGRALAEQTGHYTAPEMEKARKVVNEFIGDQPKTLSELEGNRQRLNQEAEDYFHADTAGKRAIDVSDATARAQRAAANAIRDVLYGPVDGSVPGALERAGVSAVDMNGRPVPIRELRRNVGRLLDIRDHFEDAITRAENTGDWSPFAKWRTGPSMAAGGLGAIGGYAVGGPFGALLGTLAGEGVKAWSDYLNSKNINLNVQKMFRNLEQTGTPNVPQVRIGAPQRPAIAGQLPAVGQSSAPAPIGELPQQGTAELLHPEMFPKEPIGVQAPRQTYREPETGRMARGFTGENPPREIGHTAEGGPILEPTTPTELARKAVGTPSTEPEGPHPDIEERLRQAGRRVEEQQAETAHGEEKERGFTVKDRMENLRQAAAEAPEETTRAAGELGKLQTARMEDLKEGDTFLDDKGDPRRITEITPEGIIKTADHTLRNYNEGEIQHIGEINSKQAQTARGGKFHPKGEEVEGEKKLPPQPKLPDTGQYAAIKTDDGSIYYDANPEKQRTHIMLAKDLGIPPERIVSGGWLKDGDYEGSERSDAGRFGERARAAERVNQKRAGEEPEEVGKKKDSEIVATSVKSEKPSPLKSMVAPEDSNTNLRTKLNRSGDVGYPKNAAREFTTKDGKKLYFGDVSDDQFISRMNEQLGEGSQEMKDWRNWYKDIGEYFKQNFGEGVEGARKFMAWLSSQKNTSPSGGLMNVFRTEDITSGQPQIKKGGLAEKQIRSLLGGASPEAGLGAKLHDFVDSAFGKKARTWMGDDARGGKPAVIDVHSARGTGYIDDAAINFIKETFGPEAADGLVEDLKGAPSATQYERGSERYNDIADMLNRRNYDGGGWTPEQVQAVDWAAMGKQLGREMELPADIFNRNTRSVAYELNPRENSPLAKVLDWNKLPSAAAKLVTDAVTHRAHEIAMEVAGGYARQELHKLGGWQDIKANKGKVQGPAGVSPAAKVALLSSPEAALRYANTVGYLLNQKEVFVSRALPSGNGHLFEIREVGSNKLNNPEVLKKFWDKFTERYPKAEGFSPVVDPDGTVGIQVGKRAGHFGEDTEIPKLNGAALAAADHAGISHIETEHDAADIEVPGNDWKEHPDGETYLKELDRLAKPGTRLTVTKQYLPEIMKSIREALQKHAPEALKDFMEKEKGKPAATSLPSSEISPSRTSFPSLAAD